MLDVCRDIVGNTICADFLDYIHRDWYHLGKPLYYDMRLYQYMEVRRISGTTRRQAADGESGNAEFFINVGASSKIRHDALTDILELLNARYKLAETVLFHRTKLALTGLLDRCILEISDLYGKAGLPGEKFMDDAETLLLTASDDGLPGILRKLAAGGDAIAKAQIALAIKKEQQEAESAFQKSGSTTPDASALVPRLDFNDPPVHVVGEIEAQKQLASQLIARLEDREVYRLVYKLRMSDFPGAHNPNNSRLAEVLEIYKDPKKRLAFLRNLEVLCDFPPGSLIMICPPEAHMNAKVAKVKLFIEGEVYPFDDYEGTQKEASLTRGALLAQINRFYELWAANIYVDRRLWDQYSESEVKKEHLRALLGQFFHVEAGTNPKVVRAQAQTAIDKLSKQAAQKGSIDPRKQALRGFVFPSGVPFDLE